MGLGRFNKQPFEKFPISGSFTAVLETDEEIDVLDCSVTAVDKDGVDATADILDTASMVVSGAELQIKVFAGTELLSPYKITFRAQTSLINKWEIDCLCKVEEL